jgi:hypothetical protein
MTANRQKWLACSLMISLAIALISLSCGSDSSTGTSGSQYGEVYAVVGAGDWEEIEPLMLDGGPVPMEDIESFLLAVDRIILNAEDDSSEAEEDSSTKVVIFDAEVQPAVDNEIDLVDPGNLSDIFFAAEVPPGDYTQIRLEISDPRLDLFAETVEEYITDVHLTANGRLFASVDLTISEGDSVYLEILIDRIHLVEKGGGGYVLTPQLGVELVPEL